MDPPSSSSPVAAPIGAGAANPTLRVVLVLPPTRISHGPDTFRAMPNLELTVVAEREHEVADRSIVLPARRLPVIGRPAHWTAAFAWLRDLDRVDPGAVDLVASLELFSVSSLQASRLAERLQVPHVVRVTENLVDKPPYVFPPWRQIAHRTARRADAFLCVTEGARAAAEHHGCRPERMAVIPHGLDVERFSPASAGVIAEPVVTFVGELRALKGVLDLVAAFDEVVRERPDARLQVIGDGPLRREMERLSAARPWMTLLGHRDRADIPDLLRATRGVAVPSRSGTRLWPERWTEQFGFALVEAMATGLPVVTTRCGAIPEVVPDWNPIVAEGDVAALAAGIVRVLGPDGEELGARNRAAAVERYEVGMLGATMRAAIERLLATAPRTSPSGRDAERADTC